MAVKRANMIVNWDVLDSFYDQKIYGVNMKPNGFERSFCRCGNTLSNFSNKCECCGNVSFINIKNEELTVMKNKTISFFNNEIIAKGYEAIFDDSSYEDTFAINGKELSFKEDGSGKISFEINLKNIAYLDNYDVKVLNSQGYFVNDFEYKVLKEKFPKAYEIFEEKCMGLAEKYDKWGKYLPDFVERKLYYGKEGPTIDSVELMDRVFLSALIDKKANHFLNDPIVSRYPNILKAYILDFYMFRLSWTNFECKGNCRLADLFPGLNGNYEPLEFFAKEYKTLIENSVLIDNSSYSYYYHRLDLSLNMFSKIFIKHNYDKELKTGFEDIVFNYVKNGMILFNEGVRIVEQLRTVLNLRPKNSNPFYGFREDWIHYKPSKCSSWEEKKYEGHISFKDFITDDLVYDFFKIYLKENISNKKTNLVEGFIEQIKTMQDYKIPIKEENFKVKNFNFLVNHEKLKDVYRLPQEKVDMFLDMFEVNPLEAMALVSNRRKMTKKELEAFLEVMIKQ